ncbi:unnamed protein product [Symbiodinium necroappetens]|uniref:Uncharacterized protein n=1 Tax=Symbiodinium necroappetens TaxID=1628268 RepID=A0A812KJN2_9DINO|nr:unnamed protein product [Symbiodinium necroappetens]
MQPAKPWSIGSQPLHMGSSYSDPSNEDVAPGFHAKLQRLTANGCFSLVEKRRTSTAPAILEVSVDLIVACLLGDRPTVSLAVFGEAIEHALSTGETDAVLLATELAGESAEGLAALVGQHPVDAVTSLATSPDPDALHRFLLWLPKNLDGSVDWATAEEWRASSVKSSKAG